MPYLPVLRSRSLAVALFGIGLFDDQTARGALTNVVYTKPAAWGNGQEGDGWPVRNGIIDFTGANLFGTFSSPNINFWDGMSTHRIGGDNEGNYFGHQWLGCIEIALAGEYGFGTISDDGSQVWIDGNLVVDNREVQWFDWEDNISEGDEPGATFPKLELETGMHSIEVRFYEQTVYSGIQLYWLKPGSGDSIIPFTGTTFHGTVQPSFNNNTNWEIVPQDVLSVFAPADLADFDSSGVVESNDLGRWLTGFGRTGPAAGFAQGDADGNHHVDGNDLLRWQRELGARRAAGNSIPEPSAWLLAAFAMTASLARKNPLLRK